MVSIDDFKEEKDCIYKDELYSVRDNGAIMRHHREGVRKRKSDDKWTFGNLNVTTGYLDYCGERVHRIVATAFHGAAPSDQHFVDHIDTNRQNNRPENLRWLTRLENILCNEITRKKVELICGSIEAFLNDPSLLYGYETEDKNFLWMKNVTPEEAMNCLDNWSHWAKTAVPNPNYKREERNISNWLFDKPLFTSSSQTSLSKIQTQGDIPVSYTNKKPNRIVTDYSSEELQPVPSVKIDEQEENFDDTIASLTSSARQRYWRTPTEFPFCPKEIAEDGLEVYLNNLEVGGVFSKNDKYDPYYVVDRGMGKDNKSLVVLTTNRKDNFLSWALTTITIENGKFVHENTEAKLGEEMTTKLFMFLTGQGELTDEDVNWIDAMS